MKYVIGKFQEIS